MKTKKLKFYSVILTLVLLKASISQVYCQNEEPFDTISNNGTKTNPYQIKNAKQLRWLSSRLMRGLSANDVAIYNKYCDKYYILVDNIDFNALGTDNLIYNWSGAENTSTGVIAAADGTNESNFIPIGGKSASTTSSIYRQFKGNFNGNNYIISGLRILYPTSTTDRVGLFGDIGGACIENLTLVDCKVSGIMYVGLLLGTCTATSHDTIKNIHIYNSKINAGGTNVGGLMGSSYDKTDVTNAISLVDNCSVEDVELNVVSGMQQVGGLIGYNESTEIRNSYANNIKIKNAYTQSGGLIGYNTRYSTITNCSATNVVMDIGTTTGNQKGGLIGQNDTYCNIDSCYVNKIDIKGGIEIGGMIGSNGGISAYVGHCNVRKSYATNVTLHSTGNNCGGMIGKNQYYCNIDTCYTTYSYIQSTNSSDYLGGVIGKNDYYVNVTDCFAVQCEVLNSDSHANINNRMDKGNWYGGVIGWSDGYCTLKRLYATYCTVRGGHDIGGVVGDPGDNSNDNFYECYSTNCTVLGYYYVAGLFGGGNAAFHIQDCYSTNCYIEGVSYLDGLVGYGGDCYLDNSYTTNQIVRYKIAGWTNNFGGLIGYKHTAPSRVVNSYYISTWTGDSASVYNPSSEGSCGIAKTSLEMLDPVFVSTLQAGRSNQVWYDDTVLYVNGGYPLLSISRGRQGVTYQIWNVSDMRKFSNMVNNTNHESFGVFYALLADIDFKNAPNTGSYTDDWQLDPIGTLAQPFYGTFDGNHHYITNLKLQNPTKTGVGLFGVVGGSAYLRNVAIIKCNFQGMSKIGALAGEIDPIRHISAPANTIGNGNVNIFNCFAISGSVTGESYAGGLIGYAGKNIANNFAYTNIKNCYARVPVYDLNSGQTSIGTFIGMLDGVVTSAYTVSEAPTKNFIGDNNGIVINTFGYGLLNSNNSGVSRTKVEMRDAAFLTELSSEAWSMDDVPWTRNAGYPILGYEPSSNDLVIIEDKQTITVPNNVADFNNRPAKIIIEDGGSLINNYTSGVFTNVNVERHLLNEQYVFIGSAFNTVTAGNYLGEDGSLTYNNVSSNQAVSILQFNYEMNMWKGDPGGYTYLGYNSKMISTNGYLAYVLDTTWNTAQWNPNNGGKIVIQSYNGGTLWNKDTTLSIYNGGSTHTEESNTDGLWYALSNPFSANLWVKSFLIDNTNAQGNVVYTLKADKTWDVLQANDADARVKIGEGFFVASKNGTAQRTQNFSFNRSQMTKATSKAALVSKQIKLTATANFKYAKEAYITLNNEANNGFDDLDAYKMFGQNDNFVEPYFIVMNNPMVINAAGTLPYVASLNLLSAGDNNVDLKFEHIPDGVQIVFIDLYFGTLDTITDGQSVNVNVTQGNNAGRFAILLEGELASITHMRQESDLNLWSCNNRLTINGSKLQSLEIYNAPGQRISLTKLSGNHYTAELNLASGLYVAKATSASGTKSIKFVINK